MMAITDDEFARLRGLVYDRFGINLTKEKRSLLVGRLQKLLKATGFTSFKSYYDYLSTDKTGKALDELINRVSTNYSYFYREEAHFDFFKKNALPAIIKKQTRLNSKDIRIWTAGCSTGEEPYMLVMLMMEYLGINYNGWNGGVLATDISNTVLEVAGKGIYPEDRTSKVPAGLKKKYFICRDNSQNEVVDRVKKEVTLRRFNLMNKEFPFKRPFHMIFCRNVMIYFDKPTRDALILRFHRYLEPGGYFFIGHSETIGRDQDLFKYIMPACYQRI
ncbi:MAG: chemotaxis protein CheR [Desulfobulbaceae bacterium]|nr:chemotaxis protein CheR [Desulfobulbaceae bacterium]